MQKARRHPTKGLRPLVSARFQGLFHSSVRGSFHLSFTVLVRYRSLGSIQPYGMGPADSHRITRVPRYSGYHQASGSIRIPDYHRLWSNFPVSSASHLLATTWSYNPKVAETTLVWALPRSLATTCGIIIIFFSYGYLDVSVPHVRSLYKSVTGLQPAGLPHSEIFGSIVICTYPKLIAAYHVLHRLREPRHPPCALTYFLFTLRKLFSYIIFVSKNYKHIM